MNSFQAVVCLPVSSPFLHSYVLEISFFQAEETWVLPRARDCKLELAACLIHLCFLQAIAKAATGLTRPPSTFVFSCRHLHRTVLVKSGTAFELYPIRFKFRPDHRCRLVPVKVCIFSGLEGLASKPAPHWRGAPRAAISWDSCGSRQSSPVTITFPGLSSFMFSKA